MEGNGVECHARPMLGSQRIYLQHSGHYRNVPVLTRVNFPKWEIQDLTGTADHVRVIERRRGSNNTFVNPARPTDIEACPLCPIGKRLHLEIILRHRTSGNPVYSLWTKIRSLHRSADVSLRHEAWLEFLALRRAPTEPYTEFCNRIDSGNAKIERITPSNQTAAQRGEELRLFALLSGLPFDDHIRQSLTTQSDLALAKATEACVRFDTGQRIHLAEADSANAARTLFCWKCDSHEHLSRDCPRARAVKDLITKRNAASHSGGGRRKYKQHPSTSGSNPNATSTHSAASHASEESAVAVTAFLTGTSPITDLWICDSGASSSMTGCRSAFIKLEPASNSTSGWEDNILRWHRIHSLCIFLWF